MSAWSGGLLSVGLVSAIPMVVMVAMASRAAALQRYVGHLIPLAVGALVGAAVLHLIPESLEKGLGIPTIGLLLAGGVIGFWLVDRATAHVTERSAGAHTISGRASPRGLRSLLPSAMVGDALHNVVDGVMVASAFLDQPSLGVLAGVAVALHELPRELGTFALMVRAGVSPGRAILFNAFTAAGAVAGAVLTLALGTRFDAVGRWLLPIAAGNFLYLAGNIGLLELRTARAQGGIARRMILALLGLTLSVTGLLGHRSKAPISSGESSERR